MSFSKENGRVKIDISEEEYTSLLMVIGYAAGSAANKSTFYMCIKIANVINEGNPRYTPYEIPKEYA